jgi:L-iditol 2-dehydrogenase
VLGHEFSARVEAVGQESLDGNFESAANQECECAVGPGTACGRCDLCEQGIQTCAAETAFLRETIRMAAVYCEWMHMPAHSLFPGCRIQLTMLRRRCSNR